jgi:uncharacterized protein YbjT (DUF2867 family)
MAGKILVAGVTGNLGGAVVEALLRKDILVRAGARDPGKVKTRAGVEAVKLDFEDLSTIEPALAGVGGVFLIAPPMDPDAPGKLRPVIDRAKAAGVKQIAFNSAFGANLNEESPLRVVERYLMESGVSYTITRPNFFMDNFSTGFIAPMIREHDAIFLAAGEAKTSFIAAADVAEVLAGSFAGELIGREYNLTGPAPLDHYEVAEIVSRASGRKISYQPISGEQMMEGIRQAGGPAGADKYAAALYSFVRAGYMSAVTDEVEKALGRKPVSFAEFAKAKAGAWKK